jgi:hypothetical protein
MGRVVPGKLEKVGWEADYTIVLVGRRGARVKEDRTAWERQARPGIAETPRFSPGSGKLDQRAAHCDEVQLGGFRRSAIVTLFGSLVRHS